MARHFKKIGIVLLVIAFLSSLGALWGSAAERDPSVWKLTIFFTFFGLASFGWGARYERRQAIQSGQKPPQISWPRQGARAVILIFELCMSVSVLNFGILISYGISGPKDFAVKVPLYYFLGSVVLLVLAEGLRRKLRGELPAKLPFDKSN